MKSVKTMFGMLMLVYGIGVSVPALGTVRIEGPFGDRLDRMIANHLEAMDAERLARVFRERDEGRKFWRTEFWGKYMHSAVPFRDYARSERLRRQIDASLELVLSAQEPNGYIGDYPEDCRCAGGWDIWGVKYTLMGLIHYYDGARGSSQGKKALEAAKRLCDFLISEFGRDGHAPIRHTGGFAGMPSCSVLEPVVWLYVRTQERRYLDFAEYIVKNLVDYPDGPNLVKLADVPVADRRYEVVPKHDVWHPEIKLLKAYEMMSCYQGILEYVDEVERRGGGGNRTEELKKAALKTAENIAATEINLAGGSTAGEYWYHGADQQCRHVSKLQETCVTITWMRLCEKLLEMTGDPVWADRMEQTFYNAYLASLDRRCGTFAAYTPLTGTRSAGWHHCKMHTNCCNANGARGYLSMLRAFFTTSEDVATLNFYMSGQVAAKLPKSGEEVSFRLYTTYPREKTVSVRYTGRDGCDFALRLRIPAFSTNTVVSVNGTPLSENPKAGSYCEIRRTWRRTDEISVDLALPVRLHRLHDHVAFTRGPILLARDTRFCDVAIDEDVDLQRLTPAEVEDFRLIQAPDSTMFMAVAACLPAGSHPEDPDNGIYPQIVRFTDYASAGNVWRQDCRYRVWLPELIPGRKH